MKFLVPVLYLIVCDCLAQTEPNSSEKIVIETPAEYPGGVYALHKFIHRNLRYPKQCAEGKVFVRFIVSEKGTLSDFVVLKGISSECDSNAVDVFRKMPKWSPGKHDGKPAKTQVIFPINFSLD